MSRRRYPLSVATLFRDGLDLRYEVTGSGPPLLLPELNFPWDGPVVDALAERFSVVVASPRGFMASGRLAATADYVVADMAGDVVAAVNEAGFERFFVLGYSFSGAFAPWLAQLTGRVDAVVSGGFPIVGNYAPLYAEIQLREDAARANPAAWSVLTSRFDPRAAKAFYRELSGLPANFLVDDLPCPLFAFWGDDDEEIGQAGGTQGLADGLRARGLQHTSFPGLDHEGMLARIAEAVPAVLAWFEEL